MSTVLGTLPQSVFTVGLHGPFVMASPLPAGASGYQVKFTNTLWPVTQGQPQPVMGVTVELSKDGGVTWAPIRVFRSMGAVGEYIKRLRWINLGQSRTWVFRIQYTDTARPAIIGTYVDLYKSLG